jgi:nitric oxide reductase NorD protein
VRAGGRRASEAHRDRVARLGLLASAIAQRPLQVAPGEPGEPAWTDGKVVFVDANQGARAQIEALVVQASLLAAGSLEGDIVHGLGRREALAKRYLAVEGHRALTTVEPLLPRWLCSSLDARACVTSDSPQASLAAARSRENIGDPPSSFGAIRAARLIASMRNAQEKQPVRPTVAEPQRATVELGEDATTDDKQEDQFASQVGGAGAIGKWLSKMLTAVRQLKGGGTPDAADAPTHWTHGRARGSAKAAFSTATTGEIDNFSPYDKERGTKYPEWNVHERHYRMAFCTVHEIETKVSKKAVRFALSDRHGLRRALARLGLGIDRYHRQGQGDDIDIDAAIEARVELLAGSAPDEAIFIDRVRRRRDLSVLLLLDISGSAAEPAANGKTVLEAQRAAAALLTLTLHELGDRVALYAYHSQGRSSVSLMPIKRFAEAPRAVVMERLGSLEPGAYLRLGAAIRHGTAVLQDHGGTPRRLLVVLSDGLAYDHGYEPAYGAADARRALREARGDGVGCLCLSVGSSTDAEALRRVFGSSAHAALAGPEQLEQVIAPLFRAAIRAADVRRRIE